MGAKADFHNHSTASDGRLTPSELVDLAYRNGVRIFALTDHDSTEGLDEARRAAARYADFTLVPGVELSTDVEGGEVHILGYLPEPDHPELQAALKRFREGRFERGRLMVEKLAALGKPVSWERVKEIAGEASIGRPHVALAMVEAGHVANTTEAFDLYIGRNGPAYVEREKMTPVEAVRTLRRFGAAPVLAHPTFVNDAEAVLRELVPEGLAGMEVFYKAYDAATVARLLELARRHGVRPLGGSDYHALDRPDEREPGMVDNPLPDWAIREFVEKELPWLKTAVPI
ncbi:MAG TPA: PHP domain-containing protein [Dehalococcoidia bacterium]|nr:PHP domain-containing protein [Dehalococcoidia bacterium]